MHKRDDDPERLGRAALDAYEAPEPPAGFADRVLAARTALVVAPRPRSARPFIRVGGFVAVSVAAAAAALVLSTRDGGVREGVRLAAARESVSLGARGVMVLEPGADVAFRVAEGSARIEQRTGQVFYRVDRSSRADATFVVATPAGQVQVVGTCFSVEVMPMMPSKSAIKGAAIGAAISSAVLVTVFEGRVLLASPKGQLEVAAGQSGRASPEGAPSLAAEVAEAPPAAGATVEELRKRDDEQRLEIATLRAKVKALEGQGKAAPGEGHPLDDVMPGQPGKTPFFDPSKEELALMAKECRLKWDSPPLGAEPARMGPKTQKEAGLSDEERDAFNKVSAELHGRMAADLRGYYAEVIGDAAAAKDLSPSTMMQEIEAKSPEADVQETFRRLSAERAGLAKPPTPAELKARSPVERMMRQVTTLGDAFERELAASLGKDRAHTLRASNGGWGSRSVSSHGCPGGEKGE